ncbi:MAG: antitoxin [Actinomycetes bacterium]|jgi:hypothetical protein|nr:MAG: antitoxin [Actinomycetota bacterium]
MGIGDLFKKARKAAADNKEALEQGVEKVGDFIDDKTGGRFAEHVDKGEEAAKDFIEKLDDEG